MSKQVQEAYKARHRIKHGYFDHGVEVDRMGSSWNRYRKWVNEWIETCRAARGLGRGMK